MSRTVTLLLVGSDGVPLGALPPYHVPMPWWQEVSDVVAGARDRYGIGVTVLRLLSAERPAPHGGAVTYLAEVASAPAIRLTPMTADLSPHPLRAPYAEPGGPAQSLAWAGAVLGGTGRVLGGTGGVLAGAGPTAVRQERTWNLSAIWRLRGGDATVWLKQVPWFFAHEAGVLSWLNSEHPGVAPALLAAGGAGRMLLEHVVGDDRHEAPAHERVAMVAELHEVQTRAAGALDALAALDVPDHRGSRLVAWLRETAGAASGDRLRELVAGLDDRMAAVRACGLPETLVHGDFHPGNVRAATGRRPTILDWGDSALDHPGFDALRMVEDLDPAAAAPILADWARRWRAAVPGCDPDRALALLRPVAALRNAATYAHFVANIEPAERPFHASDVPHHLNLAAELAG